MIEGKDFQRLSVVTCDNIEVAKNAEGTAYQRIREVYQAFFTAYLTEHAAALGVDPKLVVVGAGYTPSALGLESIDNTFIPLAPTGYSDNLDDKAYCLKVDAPTLSQEAEQAALRAGITPMTARDVLAVASLESAIYGDNKTLIEGLAKVQTSIIGMQISNVHRERPNLSFIQRDVQGVPHGYVVAYEGTGAANDDGTIGSQIYISDLAAEPNESLVGGLLLHRLLKTYKDNYGKPDKPLIPIFTNARDKTSFPIVRRLAERLARDAGWQVDIEEVGTYEQGGELFHNVRIYFGQDHADLMAQKQRYHRVTED